MCPGDIVVERRRLSRATRNWAEIDPLNVERVARGYRLAVEDDRPDAACLRVVRGCSWVPSRITRNTVDMISSSVFWVRSSSRHFGPWRFAVKRDEPARRES